MIRMIGREFSLNDAAARRELGYIGNVSRADGLEEATTSPFRRSVQFHPSLPKTLRLKISKFLKRL